MARSPHILLVEDNNDDIELTMLAFQRSKIANSIDVVKDGEAALDYLLCRGEYAENHGKDFPAVVLLDIQLPKLDGLEVLQQIREHEHTRRVPVVMLTSSRQQEDMVRSYDLGANSFIRKPVEFDKFVDAILQVEIYWLLLNERPRKWT